MVVGHVGLGFRIRIRIGYPIVVGIVNGDARGFACRLFNGTFTGFLSRSLAVP